MLRVSSIRSMRQSDVSGHVRRTDGWIGRLQEGKSSSRVKGSAPPRLWLDAPSLHTMDQETYRWVATN